MHACVRFFALFALRVEAFVDMKLQTGRDEFDYLPPCVCVCVCVCQLSRDTSLETYLGPPVERLEQGHFFL